MTWKAVLSIFAASIFLWINMVLAQTANAPRKEPLAKDYSFSISAERLWTDTGLDLEAGDRVHIFGTVLACEGSTPSEKFHLPLPSAPGGALLVKVHAEANPILATPDADLPIIDASHLYLGINGWHCHGSMRVRVHVEWRKPTASTVERQHAPSQ